MGTAIKKSCPTCDCGYKVFTSGTFFDPTNYIWSPIWSGELVHYTSIISLVLFGRKNRICQALQITWPQTICIKIIIINENLHRYML